VDAGSLWGANSLTYTDGTGGTKVAPLVNGANSPGLRLAAGVGVSWNTPFGLINLSLADPIVKQSGDQVQQFRVSFGTRF
jgi:outer membrane protein insertion porin family